MVRSGAVANLRFRGRRSRGAPTHSDTPPHLNAPVQQPAFAPKSHYIPPLHHETANHFFSSCCSFGTVLCARIRMLHAKTIHYREDCVKYMVLSFASSMQPDLDVETKNLAVIKAGIRLFLLCFACDQHSNRLGRLQWRVKGSGCSCASDGTIV